MPTVIMRFELTLEGASQPELTGTVRREIPEGQTLEDFTREWLREECRKEHAPRVVWSLV